MASDRLLWVGTKIAPLGATMSSEKSNLIFPQLDIWDLLAEQRASMCDARSFMLLTNVAIVVQVRILLNCRGGEIAMIERQVMVKTHLVL